MSIQEKERERRAIEKESRRIKERDKKLEKLSSQISEEKERKLSEYARDDESFKKEYEMRKAREQRTSGRFDRKIESEKFYLERDRIDKSNKEFRYGLQLDGFKTELFRIGAEVGNIPSHAEDQFLRRIFKISDVYRQILGSGLDKDDKVKLRQNLMELLNILEKESPRFGSSLIEENIRKVRTKVSTPHK